MCNYNKLLSCLVILVLGFFICGCVAFFVGSAVGALGGYAITRDTIQGETEKNYNSLCDSAVRVMEMMDASEVDDSLLGIVKAKIGRASVRITIDQLTPSTSRLKVKCRKNLLPYLTLSQKLYVRIVEHAE